MSDETEGPKEGKIVDLTKKRRQRAERAEKADKPTKAALARNVADVMKGFEGVLPAFPAKFRIVEPAHGIRLVLMEDVSTGVVQYVDEQTVVNAIVTYCHRELAGRKLYEFTHREAKECMLLWKAYSDPVPEPPPFIWADSPGRAFGRLPWPAPPEDQCPVPYTAYPHFHELMTRCSNGTALMTWIGSLFERSDRQQYVWLHGQGQNGKGALVRFLARIFGIAYRSKQPPKQDDKHWTFGLVGARLVAFPDCNAYGFPASGLFKSLTGGDPVDVEPKFKTSYTAYLNCKFIFLSNEKPHLASEKADMRRAIFCEVQPIPRDVDPGYEQKLWEEGGAFIHAAIQQYRQSYPNHGPIKVDTEALEEFVATIEEPYETFFEESFHEAGERDRVEPVKMQQLLNGRWKDRASQLRFLAWLERKHGIKRMKKRLPGQANAVWGYWGILPKSTYFGSQL